MVTIGQSEYLLNGEIVHNAQQLLTRPSFCFSLSRKPASAKIYGSNCWKPTASERPRSRSVWRSSPRTCSNWRRERTSRTTWRTIVTWRWPRTSCDCCVTRSPSRRYLRTRTPNCWTRDAEIFTSLTLDRTSRGHRARRGLGDLQAIGELA